MTETIDEIALRQENAEYLLKIGDLLSNSCPPASRFYISNFEKRLKEFPGLWKNKKKPMYCHHCGSLWNESNCKVKTQPPQQVNHHIKKLLKKERTEDWKLNNKQKKKLKRYYSSTSKIVYRCLTCQKRTSFRGSKSNSSSSCTRTSATSTPIPKLKLNKSDVNAGLFIPSPIVTNMNEKSSLHKAEVPTDNNTKVFESSLTSNDSLNMSNNMTERMPKLDFSSPNLSVSSELSSKKQSSVKRKKTLLAQILNQEQSKKKKTSLSSFLVSL